MTEQQLYPCPSCNRHVETSNRECPFCGAAIAAPRSGLKQRPKKIDLRAPLLYGSPPPPGGRSLMAHQALPASIAVDVGPELAELRSRRAKVAWTIVAIAAVAVAVGALLLTRSG